MLDIVIPTYNSQDTIRRCLESILNITSVSYKVIIVDDGSIDNTLSINNKYAEQYGNVYSISQEHQGVSSARNNGINHSYDEWICFLDSDDFINPKIFKNSIKLLYSLNDIDLLVSNANRDNKSINYNYNLYNVKSFLLDNYPFYGNEIIHVIWNKIYNNKLIKLYNIKFPIEVNVGEDLIFNLRFLYYVSGKILRLNNTYYHYQYSPGKYNNNAIDDEIAIICNVGKVIKKFQLPSNAMTFLKLKAIYAILLNEINNSNFNIRYLQILKSRLLKKRVLFNLKKRTRYREFECRVLFLLIRQPSIIILYISLMIIRTIKFYMPKLWKYIHKF